MKPERALKAGRPLARHCADLLAEAPSLDELVPAVSLLGGKLSRTLAAALARFSGGGAPAVSVGMPMDGNLASIDADIETLASHSVIAVGSEGHPVLATFTAGPVLRLVDRAFGGKGDEPATLPEMFPLSADLLIARLEVAVAEALGEAFGGSEPLPARPLRRDTSLRQLAPFPKTEDTIQIALDVDEEGFAAWSLSIAFPQSTLAALLGGRRRRAIPAAAAPGDPASEPYASVPLTVSAVLVDMPLGFAQLSRLRPGDVLPISVARNVPLMVEGRTIATGTIGDLDDRVAVQINHAF